MFFRESMELSEAVVTMLKAVEGVFRRYEVSLVVEGRGAIIECSLKRVKRFRRQALRDDVRRVLGEGFEVGISPDSERLRICWRERAIQEQGPGEEVRHPAR